MLKCRCSHKFLRARAHAGGHERWVLGDRRTEAGQGENSGERSNSEKQVDWWNRRLDIGDFVIRSRPNNEHI